jgi:myo-inositol-1(or 4)-monophosphatase
VRAARNAGDIIVRHLNRLDQLTVSSKERNDFVSEADRQAEAEIIAVIRKAYPGHSVLAEESGRDPGDSDEFQWIIDPLDGTTNFLHGLPHWAISVGLEQFGEMTAAVVFDPIRDELFWADKGSGAYVNDRRLRVSSRTQLDQALVGCGLPVQTWKGREKGFTTQMNAMADHVAGLRRLGTASLDLAWIAAGRQDAFWEYGLKPWDIAAGILLVREAGGRVGLLEGGDDLLAEGTLIAANGGLFPRVAEVLQSAGSA